MLKEKINLFCNKFANIKTWMVALIFTVVGFALYANILRAPFIWDDQNNITNNTFVADWKYLPEYFSQNLFAGSGATSDYWRPLEVLSFSFDYHFGKLSPLIYHVENILWHILAAILLYLILLRLCKNKLAVFLTTLVFLIHPLQIEAVTYISGRADPMSAVFSFASFLFFFKYKNEKSPIFNIVLSALFFVLGLLSHERTLLLPVVIAAYLLIFREKALLNNWKQQVLPLIPFVFFSLLYICLRMTIFRFGSEFDMVEKAGMSPFTILTAYLKGVAVYAGLLVFPAKLYMEKSVSQPVSFFDIYVLTGMTLSLVSLVGFFFSLKRKKILAFGISWFWIFLSLSFYAYLSMAMLWEHWLYLPMIGLWLPFFAYVTEKIKETKKAFVKISAFVLITLLLAGFSIRTIIRNNDWNDPIFFFEKNIANGGISGRVYNELGTFYRDSGRNADALSAYQKSAAADNRLFQPWYNMGTIYEYEENFDQARASYSKAIKLNPMLYPAYEALASIAAKNKNPDGAIVIYQKILEIYPADVNALLNIGALYFQKGDKEKTRAYFEKAQEIDPQNPNVHMAFERLDSAETK